MRRLLELVLNLPLLRLQRLWKFASRGGHDHEEDRLQHLLLVGAHARGQIHLPDGGGRGHYRCYVILRRKRHLVHIDSRL